MMIASITFRYEFGDLHSHEPAVPTERLQYVVVRPQASAPIGDGSLEKKKVKKVERPAPLVVPTVIPTTLPPAAPVAPSAGSVSGTAAGTGGSPVGVATGLEPSLGDGRIDLRPGTLHLPLSQAEKNDSAVTAIFREFRAAEIEAENNRGRSPKDWTINRNGQKYGLDSQYIYLGKFKLPSAILAALPIKTQGVDGAAMIRQRNADWIRDDIMSHANTMSEDDFRAAIKRIRERKDREKQEADDEKKNAGRVTPIVP